MTRRLRIAGIAVLATLLGLVLLAVGARIAFAEPRPTGAPGPEAEALADRVEAAIDVGAWSRTGAISWTIFGHRYLWDRERNLVRFEDKRGMVLTEGWRPMGRAFRDGEQVGGTWKDKRVATAYASFVNDAFWAFAPTKLRDEGTALSLVTPDQLLVSYGTGGVTPGDAYQWEVGPDGLPVAFRIWAQVLVLPGARFQWDEWVTLPTGARVATVRRGGPVVLRVTDLEAAEHLNQLVPGEDPFAPMFGP